MKRSIDYPAGRGERQYRLQVYDRSRRRTTVLTPCVDELVWSTWQKEQPAKLEVTLLKAEGVSFFEGDDIALYVDGQVCFKGFVFAREKDQRGFLRVTCYDQLRYLRARQSYNFSGFTAGQIVRRIAADLGLRVGDVADTGYAIPSLIADDKTCLDTICRALEATATAIGRSYQFFDEGGALVLRGPGAMRSPYVLGDASLTSSYSYRTSIDDNVYNYIKLVRPDATSGDGEAVVARSAASMAEWGRLQFYERVNGQLNAAQLREAAKSLLAQYNRLQRTLTVSCLGLWPLRAGQIVKVELATMGDLSLDERLVAERVIHRCGSTGHTMEITFSLCRTDFTDVSTDSFHEYLDVALKTGGSGGGSTGGGAGNKATVVGDTEPGIYRQPYHGNFRLSTLFGATGSAWSCGWHTGTDYVGIGDKRIYAITTGQVKLVSSGGAYGKHVYIQHTDGYLSVYAHLGRIDVVLGQWVNTDTQIGVEGGTGNASGPHLHLELHQDGYHYPPTPAINPYIYIESHLGGSR